MRNTMGAAPAQKSIFLLFVIAFLLGCALYQSAWAAPGDLDTTFSGDGKALFDIFQLEDQINALAQQKDGKIVAAGYTYNAPFFYLTVLRLNSNGTLDSNFGSGGVVISTLARTGDAVAIQEDGMIVTAGHGVGGDFTLVRLTPTGAVDTSFGTNGAASTDFGGNDFVTAMSILNDGKILVAGWQLGGSSILIAKYTATGQPDLTFGAGGKVNTPFSSKVIIHAMTVQPDGKILVGGGIEVDSNGNDEFFLARYTSGGTPDSGFGNAGIVTTQIKNSDWIVGLQLYPSGQILAAGTSEDQGTQGNYAMTVYSPKGELQVIWDTDINVDSNAAAVAFRPDGKIVIAGTWGSNFGIQQFLPSFNLDTSFNTDGVLNIDFENNLDIARALLIQSDGSIVVAGMAVSGAGPTSNFALARVKGFSDSPLLTEYFNDGIVNWPVQSGAWAESSGSLHVPVSSKAIVNAPASWSPSGVSGCSECTHLVTFSTTGGPQSKVMMYAWKQGSNYVQLIINPEKGKWVLKQKYSGVMTKNAAKLDVLPGVTYHVGLSYNEERIRLWVDGTVLIDFAALEAPFGNLGFTVKNTSVSIDRVAVHAID